MFTKVSNLDEAEVVVTALLYLLVRLRVVLMLAVLVCLLLVLRLFLHPYFISAKSNWLLVT